MLHFKLNIKFSEDALKTIYKADQCLTITKIVTGDSGKEVIWVSTLPFKVNSVEWDESYSIYASREDIQNDTNITKLAKTKAVDNVLHEFQNAIFQEVGEADCVGLKEYAVHNIMKQYDKLTFGLAQDLDVNGQIRKDNPINALTLPYNHTAVMSPVEKVKVFLAKSVSDGMLISKTIESSNAIEVDFTKGKMEKTIVYNCEKGEFVLEK